jgi:hypothetical protein
MTVSEDVFNRVEELVDAGAASRAAAIRQVAGETGRTVSATSSAYYSARRARAQAPAAAEAEEPAKAGRRRGTRASGHSDAPRLYAEMLPLVEAGATIEQAARRFGNEDSVPEIAAGFARWRARQGEAEPPPPVPPPAPAPDDRVAVLERAARDAEARITALEAENRALRRDLTRARQAITRVRAILDTAAG